ncbi:hypothetical protein MMC25_000173 [Agyrium rufum]|nr:hypothetical protein [Agyrium rufum]
MRVAEVLSDLTSLRVCDHDAALLLVTSYKDLEANREDGKSPIRRKGSKDLKRSASIEGADEDPDLQRAIDLVDLHHGVKEKHTHGLDMSLQQARRDVDVIAQRMLDKSRGEKTLG